MMAVPPAVRRLYVRKCCAVTQLVDVDAIADARSELHRVRKNTGHGARRDVHHVIVEPASVRKAGIVTRQEPQAPLTSRRRWRNAGVQSEEIRNRSRVLGAASWTDGSQVLDQREQ